MGMLVRDWELHDLAQQTRCVTCGARGARPARPVLADGFSAAKLDDYVPWIPLCAACALRQMHVGRRLARAVYALALAPIAVLALFGALVPAQSAWPVVLAVALAVPLAWLVARALLDRSRPPALVVEGAGSVLRLHLDAPDALVSSHGEVSHAPNHSGAGFLFMLAALAATGVGWWTWDKSNPVVLFDNPSDDPCLFSVDGTPYMLPPAQRAGLRLHAGEHHAGVNTRTHQETLTFEVPRAGAYVVAVSEPGCYVGLGRKRTFAVDDLESVHREQCAE